MSFLGIIAFATGILGVWFTIKQNILCWPLGLISVIASMMEFFFQRLYGDMSLQIIYFIAGIYGWIYWKKKQGEEFIVTRIVISESLILFAFTVIQSFIYYFLLIYFKGDRPFLDSILTAFSITTTYMMTKKYLENWLVWTVVDLTYVFLYGLKSMWLFAILNLIFSIIAFYGWLKWKKTV